MTFFLENSILFQTNESVELNNLIYESINTILYVL